VRDAGDEAAWSQFVAIYTPLIFGFCRGRGLNETDSSDVTQEVLKAVAGALPRFQYEPGRSTFRNWLFTVVRSKLNNFITAQARWPKPAGQTTLQQFAEVAEAGSDEEAWRREHQSHLVRWAADQICSEYKEGTWQAFWRTSVLGQDPEQVAGELGLSVNAVYIARSRVTSRLKEVIEALGDPLDGLEGFAHA
jgi:RNA polymerase sigma-70 factor (ECF subfamily)